MANERHKPEEIVQKLRQVDVLVGQGMARVGIVTLTPPSRGTPWPLPLLCSSGGFAPCIKGTSAELLEVWSA